jgi:hypothetical protein
MWQISARKSKGMPALDFPYAQIKTSISKAQWNLQEQKVYMTKPPDVDIENSYFYATREELDSLAFNAEAAEYDLADQPIEGFRHSLHHCG